MIPFMMSENVLPISGPSRFRPNIGPTHKRTQQQSNKATTITTMTIISVVLLFFPSGYAGVSGVG